MKSPFVALALAAACLFGSIAAPQPAAAAPPSNISMSVGLCDPWFPQRCAMPDALGNLHMVGSGPTSPGAAASGSVLMGAIYKATPFSPTDGQMLPLTTSARGALWIEYLTPTGVSMTEVPNTQGAGASVYGLRVVGFNRVYNGSTWDLIASINGAASLGNAGTGTTAVEETGRPFANITTNTTTTVKTGKGFLHTICINTKGATANTATIYDNTTGVAPKIGTLDTTSGVACMQYDVAFTTGLTIVTATGTAADLTVSYR